MSFPADGATLCAALQSHAKQLESASTELLHGQSLLRARCLTAIERLRAAAAQVLSFVGARRGLLLRKSRDTAANAEKVSTERWEEADACEKLLLVTASAAELVSTGFSPRPLEFYCSTKSFEALSAFELCMDWLGQAARPCFLVDVEVTFADVFSSPIDAALSEISGPGLSLCHVRTDCLVNDVRAVPRVSGGALAAYVTPADIIVSVLHDGVPAPSDIMITIEESHAILIETTVRLIGTNDRLCFRLSICGVHVAEWSPSTAFAATNTALAASYGIQPAPKTGLVVTPDMKHAVISYHIEGVLRIYQLYPTFVELHALSGFASPRRLCMSSADMFLVCEYAGDAVREVTLTGATVRSIRVPRANSIDKYEDLLAVGNFNSSVFMLRYSTGEVLHEFKQLCMDSCHGLRFTHDGSHFIVADYGARVSMFTCNGELTRRIGESVLHTGYKDVELTATGDLIVADYGQGNGCITIFSAGTFECVSSWKDASRSVCATPVSLPTVTVPVALTIRGPHLFVLDQQLPRLQVFV